MPWQHTIHLRYADLDYQGHVTAAAYLMQFEEARVAWLAAAWETAFPAYALVRQEITYLAEVRLDDSPLTIALRVVDVRRASFDIEEELTARSGELKTRSAATLVAWDRDRRRSRALSERQRAALA